MSLETDMNRALEHLRLEGWEALWQPDPSQKVNGQVLSKQKVILVFAEDPVHSQMTLEKFVTETMAR